MNRALIITAHVLFLFAQSRLRAEAEDARPRAVFNGYTLFGVRPQKGLRGGLGVPKREKRLQEASQRPLRARRRVRPPFRGDFTLGEKSSFYGPLAKYRLNRKYTGIINILSRSEKRSFRKINKAQEIE